MMGLPDGPKSFKIGLVVLIQYRLWRTPSHPASHVAVAITLHAKASSLKMKSRNEVYYLLKNAVKTASVKSVSDFQQKNMKVVIWVQNCWNPAVMHNCWSLVDLWFRHFAVAKLDKQPVSNGKLPTICYYRFNLVLFC